MIHLISSAQAEALLRGEQILCRWHTHASRRNARKLLRSETVEWATMPDGRVSSEYLIVQEPRAWHPRNGVMQLLPLSEILGGRRPAQRGRRIHMRPQRAPRRRTQRQGLL